MTATAGAVHTPWTSRESDEDDTTSPRPNKRRRLSLGDTISNAENISSVAGRQLCLEEIDLEIELQQRLAVTIQSRVEWALLLQESLQRNINGPSDSVSGFKDAALDALEALESPVNCLYVQSPQHLALIPALPAPTSTSPLEEASQTSHTPATRTRGAPRVTRAPPKKLLFIRNNTIDPPQVAKLACPDCARTDFSSLQGLLNHCRIRHRREFGSHDECIQCSAVLIEGEEDQAWVAANGMEVGGISLPSLRRLFEIAVNGHAAAHTPVPTVQANSILGDIAAVEVSGTTAHTADNSTGESRTPSTHLTRTLGHHKDTPALAPFLGKIAKRRCINSHDEEDAVDIFGQGDARVKATWRKPYSHRNNARASLNAIVPVSSHNHEVVSPTPPTEEVSHNPNAVAGSGSRFHIVARVSIEDHSLWVPPGRRSESRSDHTHRWRLTISAPSYSLPINSFLANLTITCLSDPPPSTLVEPITISNPPFVVTSTTDRPFLARLTFTWVGADDLNPPAEVEHWVELDPMHLSTPVLGDEQVFDVELDRNTALLHDRQDQGAVSWDEDGELQHQKSVAKLGHSVRDGDVKPEYVLRLKSVLPLAPMTLKDTKGRSSKHVPYTLVSTPAQFRNLVYGRRKAIEWGRAMAIREAYEKCPEPVAPASGEPYVPLTTADVYHWLEDEGLFPGRSNENSISLEGTQHASKINVRENSPTMLAEAFCRRCGLHQQLHPVAPQAISEQSLIKQEPAVEPIPINPEPSSVCTVFDDEVAGVPVLDITRLLSTSHDGLKVESPPSMGSSSVMGSSSDFVALADPALVLAIQQLAKDWHLPHLDWSALSRSSPADALALSNRPKSHVDEELAPFALLALLTKLFTRLLIQSGLTAFRRDIVALRALGRQTKPRGRKTQSNETRRLLVPSHVIRGIAVAGDTRGTPMLSRLICTGSLGGPILSGEMPSDDGTGAL